MLVRNAQEGGLYDTKLLQKPNPNFMTRIRPAEQDSYYDLVAAAEGYWRAFNTNGTPEYHRAEFWPNVLRLENGVRTTDVPVAGSAPMGAAEQFDLGYHAGRNVWDLRYPVVDEEYGVVMSVARFGMKTGAKPQRPAQAAERLVAEFFAVRKGIISDIQAVMVNRDEKLPSAWPPDYGPDAWRLGARHLRPGLPHWLHRRVLQGARRQRCPRTAAGGRRAHHAERRADAAGRRLLARGQDRALAVRRGERAAG